MCLVLHVQISQQIHSHRCGCEQEHQVLVPAFLAVYPLDANAAGAESGVTAAQGPICSLSVFLSVQDHSVGSTNNSSQVLRAIQGHLGSTLGAMLSVKLHFMLSWPRL